MPEAPSKSCRCPGGGPGATPARIRGGGLSSLLPGSAQRGESSCPQQPVSLSVQEHKQVLKEHPSRALKSPEALLCCQEMPVRQDVMPTLKTPRETG